MDTVLSKAMRRGQILLGRTNFSCVNHSAHRGIEIYKSITLHRFICRDFCYFEVFATTQRDKLVPVISSGLYLFKECLFNMTLTQRAPCSGTPITSFHTAN